MSNASKCLEWKRQEVTHRPVEERIRDFFEIEVPLPEPDLIRQAGRCMDCGVPFCHGSGCPLGNLIPDMNDSLSKSKWRTACDILHSTNNFPEITGRICPALCEAACTRTVNDEPVLIRHIECQIAERGFAENWIGPLRPAKMTGKRVAVIGSGPAGLAMAQQLARSGHEVTVFEKDDGVGGLLRYGIPAFKLDKRILDRRLRQLMAEGVQFVTGITVGKDISCRYLRNSFDATCVTIGAEIPSDLRISGRHLDNVLFATDYLKQQVNAPLEAGKYPGRTISVKDKTVVVIGGGDTGSDCVGTARRQGAKEIYQFEILPQPSNGSQTVSRWPLWSATGRASSSHQEGCTRRWCVSTKGLSGIENRVVELHGVEVEWNDGSNGRQMREIPGTEFTMKVDVVLLAMGFAHVAQDGLVGQFGLDLDERGNVKVDDAFLTSRPGVFAAGDSILGASLVAKAIYSGRQAAANMDHYLMHL